MKITNAFIATGETIQLAPHDSLTYSCIYSVGGYTPRFWRRRRLVFARPVVHRLLICRALWRWLP